MAITLTQDRLKELLSYDPSTGEFRWKVSRQRVQAGALAGVICKYHGYRIIGVDYKSLRAPRLAWLYMTGSFPDGLIDHIDRNRLNDAWSNLRLVDPKQNTENRTVSKRSTSGYNGVSWIPKRKRWVAYIQHNRKSFVLGRFKDIEDAIAARAAAERQLFTHGLLCQS